MALIIAHLTNRRKQKIERRVIVITQFRILTLRTGLMSGYRVYSISTPYIQEAREGLIIDMRYLTLDDSDRISIEMDGWGITFHALHNEQLLSSLLDRYNKLCSLIPDSQRAIFSIEPSILSHATFTPQSPRPDPATNITAYRDAVHAMFPRFHILI